MAVERVFEKGKLYNGLLKPPFVPLPHPYRKNKGNATKAGREGSVFEWRWCPKHNHAFKVKRLPPPNVLMVGKCVYCAPSRRRVNKNVILDEQ